MDAPLTNEAWVVLSNVQAGGSVENCVKGLKHRYAESARLGCLSGGVELTAGMECAKYSVSEIYFLLLLL